MSDHGYVNLVRHLTRASTTIPLETLQASIAHYLARPPVPVPGSPTPLVAAALSSALLRSHADAALALTFRHAVHLRVGVLKEECTSAAGGLFASQDNSAKVARRLGRWCKDVWAGFRGSAPLVRLACATGMLLGLEDWEGELKVKERESRVRAKAEEEVVLALAAAMDAYASDSSGWGVDFKRAVDAKEQREGVYMRPFLCCLTMEVILCIDPLALAIMLAAQCAASIDPQRLQALLLPVRDSIQLRGKLPSDRSCRLSWMCLSVR